MIGPPPRPSLLNTQIRKWRKSHLSDQPHPLPPPLEPLRSHNNTHTHTTITHTHLQQPHRTSPSETSQIVDTRVTSSLFVLFLLAIKTFPQPPPVFSSLPQPSPAFPSIPILQQEAVKPATSSEILVCLLILAAIV